MSYRTIVLDRQIPGSDSLMVEAYNFFKRRLLEGTDANGDPVVPAQVLTTLEHCTPSRDDQSRR